MYLHNYSNSSSSSSQQHGLQDTISASMSGHFVLFAADVSPPGESRSPLSDDSQVSNNHSNYALGSLS